jgi:hypothetical protein
MIFCTHNGCLNVLPHRQVYSLHIMSLLGISCTVHLESCCALIKGVGNDVHKCL